jgi:small subunit ribosomal protein S8
MTKHITGDIITIIRNAVRVKSFGVEVQKTQITQSFAKILLQEGLIVELSEFVSFSTNKRRRSFLFLRLKYFGKQNTSVITNLKRVSRPSLRIYTSYNDMPKILGGLGLIILSTPRGLMTDRKAVQRKLGGEIICSIWLYLLYESTIFGEKNL